MMLHLTLQIEFMELLVLQLLDPIGKRVLASPSPSWPYLCPRIIERCISVAMECVQSFSDVLSSSTREV